MTNACMRFRGNEARKETSARGEGAEVDAEPPRKIQIVEDQWASFRHIIEAVAIIAAGLWAFYTFIYQERIKPAAEPAALSETISIHRLGRDAKRDILGITLTYHNAGKTEIDIAADAYNIVGVRYGSASKRFAARKSNREDAGDDVPTTSIHLIRAFAELRDAAVGGQPGFHIILQPGDTQTDDELVTVPRGAYDLINAQIIAVPVKTSLGHRVPITIKHNRIGGVLLASDDPGVDEDDTETSFALVP